MKEANQSQAKEAVGETKNSKLSLGGGPIRTRKENKDSDKGEKVTSDLSKSEDFACQKFHELRTSRSKEKQHEPINVLVDGPLVSPLAKSSLKSLNKILSPYEEVEGSRSGPLDRKRKSSPMGLESVSSRTRGRNLKQAARDRGNGVSHLEDSATSSFPGNQKQYVMYDDEALDWNAVKGAV
ncbi:hypothetical protein ACFE04_007410 [Oxalis oulophora]